MAEVHARRCCMGSELYENVPERYKVECKEILRRYVYEGRISRIEYEQIMFEPYPEPEEEEE